MTDTLTKSIEGKPMSTQIKEEIKKLRNKIFYHILAWFEDEGDYQPTQEEAEKTVDDILASALQRMQEMTIEAVKKEFYRGCTRDEVVPRLNELREKLQV